MTYLEKSTELACAASVAVMVLANGQNDDIEFLPLQPRRFSDAEMLDLRARWAGRDLRSVGVIGLVGATPECAFKEPLGVNVTTSLAGAFLAYLQSLFRDGFAAQLEGFEVQELCRLWSLADTRTDA
jgi:hypothetical protein